MDYQIIRSSRKTIALQLRPDGSLVVRAPRHMSAAAIEKFVASKEGWIAQHLAKREPLPPTLTPRELEGLKSQAKTWFPARVAQLAPLVGVSCGRITIRSQRGRWGSCSGRGNLNFNCLLMLAPEEIRDYVVIHELCHRIEMNHSPKFWGQVQRCLPDYEIRRRWLRDHGNSLLGRLPQD